MYSAQRQRWQSRFCAGQPKPHNPHGCRYLVTHSVATLGPGRFRRNLYNVWDLHIWKDTALMFCGICRANRPEKACRASLGLDGRDARPYPGSPKNESAQDPGLSLRTPVEQPSPRTAQTQIRFRAPERKWPCRASRQHHWAMQTI